MTRLKIIATTMTIFFILNCSGTESGVLELSDNNKESSSEEKRPTNSNRSSSSSTPSSSVVFNEQSSSVLELGLSSHAESSSAEEVIDLESTNEAIAQSSNAIDTYSSSKPDSNPTLKVMSYNLWFTGTWITSRREIAYKMIKIENPDIIGIQENWDDQGIGYPPTRDILATLPEYTSAAFEDRNDILYKKKLFTVVDSGRFDLGEKAEGRHVAWALFKDTLDRHFYLYNTHWNYRDFGEDDWLSHGVTLASAIRNREYPNYPAIATGDFNSNDEAGAKYFRGELDSVYNSYPFRDTWADINNYETEYHSTKTLDKHGRVGEKLDYIYVPQDEWITIDAQIVTYRDPEGCGNDQASIYYEEGKGCAPSDHEPIWSELQFK